MSIIACYDAGDIRSYVGGLVWRDVSGQAADITAGGSTDPVFYGDYGGLSVAERWRFGGAGRFTAASNPAAVETFHKDNAKLTIIVWASLSAIAAQGLIGNNANSSANPGFALRTQASGYLNWLVTSGASIICNVNTSSLGAVPLNAMTMFSVAIDEAVPLVRLGVNTSFVDSASAYISPLTTGATYPFQVGAIGNNINSIASGGKLGEVVVENGVARSQAQLTTIYNDTKSRWGL